MKPIARWTIGNTFRHGYECLIRSIHSFLAYYDLEVNVYYNCKIEAIHSVIKKFPEANFVDQSSYLESKIKPMGVAWKLYPLRIDITRHEISIDNDIILNEPVPEIEKFFQGTHTLLLEDIARAYGKFEKHVPPGLFINSGIYGMPPGFDLSRYFNFYVHKNWDINALGNHAANKTFDEQGFIALALSNKSYTIIPNSVITNCEWQLVEGKGHHFIGLNRRNYHEPYQLYKNKNTKHFL